MKMKKMKTAIISTTAGVILSVIAALACDKQEASSAESSCDNGDCSGVIPYTNDNGRTFNCSGAKDIAMFPSTCNTVTNMTQCDQPTANCSIACVCKYDPSTKACVTDGDTGSQWTQKNTKITDQCSGG